MQPQSVMALVTIVVAGLLAYLFIKQEDVQDENEEKAAPSGVVPCCVCLHARPSVAILPCRHLCLCKSCHRKLRSATCPLCRGPVNEIVELS